MDYIETLIASEHDRQQRLWVEGDVGDIEITEPLVDTEDDGDDDRLRRLGINTIPRPETVDAESVQFVTADTMLRHSVRISDMTDFAVTGTMTYNGEDLESVIRRVVREELQNLRREEE